MDTMKQAEASTHGSPFGRCRRCGGPSERFLFAGPILWVGCSSCRVAWWAMFSRDQWGLSEMEASTARLFLAGWDVGNGEEEAHLAGIAANIALEKLLGLPPDPEARVREFVNPDGQRMRLHLRVTPFEHTPLVIQAHEPDDDAYGIAVGRRQGCRLVGWVLGREAKKPEFLRGIRQRLEAGL